MKINVVGLGPGNIKYISAAGIDCIKEAEIIVGSSRQLSDLKSVISEKQEIYILGSTCFQNWEKTGRISGWQVYMAGNLIILKI